MERQLLTYVNMPAGMKNIIRGAGLAVFVTFLGCFLSFTAPDLVAAQLGKTLPYWFYESEVSLGPQQWSQNPFAGLLN